MSGTTTTTLQCGACGQANASEAQFCVGCGHSLREPCDQCQTPVTLVQKFCVTCGTDLDAMRRRIRANDEEQLVQAVALAKSLEFDKSINKLRPIAGKTDFRLKDLSGRAAEAIKRVEQIRDQTAARARADMDAAADAIARDDRPAAMTLLRRVPAALLDEAARQTLASSENFVSRLKTAKAELKKAIELKDYRSAAGWVTQVLELNPGDQKATKLSLQIRDKLLHGASRMFDRCQFEAAVAAIESLPTTIRDQSDVSELARVYRRASFLSDQPNVDPQITPVLGRLAMRWQSECPTDGRATLAVEQLTEAIKRPRRDPRDAARWADKPPRGWAGATVRLFDQPAGVTIAVDDLKPRSFDDLSVATGLALTAVGRGHIDGNLVIAKGLASKLAGRPKTAWGVDVGSTGLRAVKIELIKGQDKPSVTAVIRVPIDPPLGRLGSDPERLATLTRAIEQFKSEAALEKQVVWANISAEQTTSRFVELPPVPDKKADLLIQTEFKGRVPIPLEDLRTITWRAPFDAKNPASRPAVLAAVTNVAASSRIDELTAAGLTVNGLLPDPIATVNFLSLEFADVLRPAPVVEEPKVKTATTPQAPPPAGILAIDAGTHRTTWLMIAARSIWYWSHEAGGESATAAAARVLQTKLETAESAKRNLPAATWPDELDGAIAEVDGKLRIRLQRLDEERRTTLGQHTLPDLWVLGRAARQYGFVRRVLL